MKKQVVLGLLGAAFFACGESPAAPACGDGVIDAGEQCEPPNSASCDAACLVVNLNCGDGLVDGAEQCDDSNVVSGDGCRANCTNEVCGDGLQDPQEQCDDGNTTNGDGCSSACAVEGGGVCGNNQAEAGEGCDDGNTTNGDGCNARSKQAVTAATEIASLARSATTATPLATMAVTVNAAWSRPRGRAPRRLRPFIW